MIVLFLYLINVVITLTVLLVTNRKSISKIDHLVPYLGVSLVVPILWVILLIISRIDDYD